MKPAILLTLGASLLLAAGGPVPRKAPALMIHTGPQTGLKLSDYAGKTVILAFILTDCSHCEYTTGLLNKIQSDYASRDVVVVETALDPTAPDRFRDFQKKHATIFPVGYNGLDEATRFLGYAGGQPMLIPVIVFIDRNGTIRAQVDGESGTMTKEQEENLRLTLDKTMQQGETAGPPAASGRK